MGALCPGGRARHDPRLSDRREQRRRRDAANAKSILFGDHSKYKIRRVRDITSLPLAAYNVSGEFSAVKAAAANGWLDEAGVVRENLQAMVRAGAYLVITYHAREALAGRWL